MNDLEKYRISRLCNHEAGHLIVSKIFGFKTDGISLIVNPGVGHSGEATTILPKKGIDNIDKLIIYLNERIQILYAGVIAEATDINKNYNQDYALNEWRNGGGKVDHAKVRELTHVLRNITNPDTYVDKKHQEELDELDSINFDNAVQIVFDNIELIHEVGKLLSNKVILYNTNYDLSESELNELEKIEKLNKNLI